MKTICLAMALTLVTPIAQADSHVTKEKIAAAIAFAGAPMQQTLINTVETMTLIYSICRGTGLSKYTLATTLQNCPELVKKHYRNSEGASRKAMAINAGLTSATAASPDTSIEVSGIIANTGLVSK